ncbi:MAG TPA: DUF309 domain-containing protein [Trueperaceae bacterium]
MITEQHRQAWEEGVRLFEAGRYWECHEALEPAWLEASGSEKRFLGGVILLAAALHKARGMGSARGGRRNYAKALSKLAPVGDRFWGVDVRELEALVHAALRRDDLRPCIPRAAEAGGRP